MVLSLPTSREESEQVRGLVVEVRRSCEPPSKRYDRRELDEVRIVAEWLVAHETESLRLPWDPELDPEEIVQQVFAGCETLAQRSFQSGSGTKSITEAQG
jgi:hypothetical protein